jgi:hypothetical protein
MLCPTTFGDEEHMSNLSNNNRRCNGTARGLPLLELIERVQVRSLPLPARKLAARFGLPAATALVVAAAAGFYTGGER